MKKLRHCHPMYILTLIYKAQAELYVSYGTAAHNAAATKQ